MVGSGAPAVPRELLEEPGSRARDIDPGRMREFGFDVIRLFDEQTVHRILGILEDEDAPFDAPFFASPAHAWDTSAPRIHERLKELCGPRMNELLPAYRQFMIAVTSKSALTGAEIKYHTDWTYTDERTHLPIFMWSPLVDCTSESGALRVVPGSHRWSTGIRPSRRIQLTEHYQEQYEALSVGSVMTKGDAIVFYPSMLHGSWPNPTPNRRPAITIASAPADAQLVHFHLADPGHLTGYAVDEAFFTTNHYGEAPSGYPEYYAWTDIVAFEELDPSTP